MLVCMPVCGGTPLQGGSPRKVVGTGWTLGDQQTSSSKHQLQCPPSSFIWTSALFDHNSDSLIGMTGLSMWTPFDRHLPDFQHAGARGGYLATHFRQKAPMNNQCGKIGASQDVAMESNQAESA